MNSDRLKQQMIQFSEMEKRKRMQPPYTCPFCGWDRGIEVRKNKEEHHVWCRRGCFDVIVICERKADTKMDMFNKAVDKVRRKGLLLKRVTTKI